MNSSLPSDSFDFCPQLQNLITTGSAIGRNGKTFGKLSALSTSNNLLTIRALMMEYNPQRTLEIGLAFGGSALTIASSHRDLQHSPCQQHVAIDPFQSTVWDSVGRDVIEKAELADYTQIHEGFSFTVLPQLLLEKQKFDLIYIDGSHLFENVFLDFYYASKLLAQGGILIFDDSSSADIRKVLNFVDANLKEAYRPLDLAQSRAGAGKLKLLAITLLKKNQMTAYQKVGKSDRSYRAKLKNF
jgi:cephalosporin hydroxylase